MKQTPILGFNAGITRSIACIMYVYIPHFARQQQGFDANLSCRWNPEATLVQCVQEAVIVIQSVTSHPCQPCLTSFLLLFVTWFSGNIRIGVISASPPLSRTAPPGPCKSEWEKKSEPHLSGKGRLLLLIVKPHAPLTNSRCTAQDCSEVWGMQVARKAIK